MTPPNDTQKVRDIIWNGSIPLEIRLAPSESRVYDQSDPYLVHHHRISYLPFLLPRLHSFFSDTLIDSQSLPHNGWFSFEGVPLKWHYPLGLLYDLFSGASPAQAPNQRGKESLSPDEQDNPLPWRLLLHFAEWPEDYLVRLDKEGKFLHDAFINSVKEADFLRNGTAKRIMSLSKDDSTRLWQGVENHDFAMFNPISQKLLNTQGAALRHIPIRIYLPSSPTESEPTSGHLRVVQSLITPRVSNSREPQTLGVALHHLLPLLFPSRRIPILAKPLLHGAVIPMSVPIEELLKVGAYLDGWLHLGIMMIG